jgi:outer membrane receptor protein involved in Fe transport
MNRLKFLVVVVPLVLSLGTTSALGQARQESTIVGTVKDSTGAVLPGVSVTVVSPDLVGGAVLVVTDPEGKYRVGQLKTGLYELTFELTGFRTVVYSDYRVPYAQTLTQNVTMEIASVAETVTVIGESPVVDVTSSASSTNLTDEILQNVPIGRFQPDVINLAPGVNNDVAFGGTDSSNALLMDGVDVSDPDGGSPWSFFNYNWIGETQIVALGSNAEYGEFTGIAANSVVRSGGNNFSGLLEYWTTRGNWIGDNTGSLPPELREDFEPNQYDAWWDLSAQIGGPILRDRLFFFTGFQYYKQKFRPAGFTGGWRTEDSPRFITKINWAVNDNMKLEGFLEKDKYDVKGRGAGPFRPPETTVIEPSPETNWNIRFSWVIDENTLFDIRNGGYSGYFPLWPTPPGTLEGPAPHYEALTGMYSINTPYWGNYTRKPNVTAATLTKYAERFAGRHEFKFGFEFEHAKVRNESGYPGNRFYYDYGGEPYIAYLWDGYDVNSSKNRIAVYAQDAWSVNDHLTINAGIRFNFNRGKVPELGTVLATNPISPRIGFAYDISGDARTVLRAHWGRYYDALLAGHYGFMDTSVNPPFITALIYEQGGCASGEGPNCEVIDFFVPENNFGIDPDITHSYLDQFLVGVERELMRDFSLTAQYIRRDFKDFMGFVDTRSVYEPVQRQDPGPDNVLGTSDDGEMLTVYNLTNPGEAFKLFTNPEGAYRDYNAFQIVANKRFSDGWQLLGSYTWSETKGNIDNAFGINAGGGSAGGHGGLGQNGQYVNPNQNINQDGRNRFDPTHAIKLQGTYRIPVLNGIYVGGVYRYLTGNAWGRLATIRDLNQGSESVQIEPRGTRRVDALNAVDFRVETTVPIVREQYSFGVFFDIFNLNNQGVADSNSSRPVQMWSGSSFGEPRVWVNPRTFRLGVRFQF